MNGVCTVQSGIPACYVMLFVGFVSLLHGLLELQGGSFVDEYSMFILLGDSKCSFLC